MIIKATTGDLDRRLINLGQVFLHNQRRVWHKRRLKTHLHTLKNTKNLSEVGYKSIVAWKIAKGRLIAKSIKGILAGIGETIASGGSTTQLTTKPTSGTSRALIGGAISSKVD